MIRNTVYILDKDINKTKSFTLKYKNTKENSYWIKNITIHIGMKTDIKNDYYIYKNISNDVHKIESALMQIRIGKIILFAGAPINIFFDFFAVLPEFIELKKNQTIYIRILWNQKLKLSQGYKITIYLNGWRICNEVD